MLGREWEPAHIIVLYKCVSHVQRTCRKKSVFSTLVVSEILCPEILKEDIKSLNPCGQILVEKGTYPGKAACTAVLARDVIDFGGSKCVFLHEGEGSCS